MPDDTHPAPPEKFYLTTPIYYVNARPHIGHAYSTIVADVLARRHRLLGRDTFFLTGTDEHGQKIERSAAAAGIPPQQFADQVSKTFSDLWQRMGITNDDFIRTTDPRHKQGVQRLFQTLYDQGHIYLSTYTGQYSIGEEMFVDGPPGTIGPDGRPTETVTEENFFFRLSDFQQPLLDLIESDTLRITPESSKNEVLSFIRGGLKDLSVSRSSFKWGIPVPEAVQQAAGTTQPHVIYVWLDALANYMTAIGYGSDLEADKEKFARFWPANLHVVGKEITRFHCVYWPAFLLALNPDARYASSSNICHPSATREDLLLDPSKPPKDTHNEWAAKWLPKAVTANGWLLFDNSKMSKSKGNVVRTETILEAFGEHVYKKQFPDSTKQEQDLFAADVLRYYLLREIPFGQDGSFNFESMVTRYNADLVNGYGNLVSRVLNLIVQNFEGAIPQHEPFEEMIGLLSSQNVSQEFLPSDATDWPLSPRGLKQFASRGPLLANRLIAVYSFYADAFSNLRFSLPLDPELKKTSKAGVIDSASFLISETDGLITATAPWKLAKSSDTQDRIKLADHLYTVAESIRLITALLYPIIPNATAKVWAQLGLGSIEEAAANGDLKNLQWGGLKPGTKLGPLAPIFPRADKSLATLMEDLEAASAPKPQSEKALAMPTTDTSQQPAASATHPAEPLKDQGEPIPASNPDPKDDPTHPAAPPRTASLDTQNPGAQVGASHALTTERPGTPPHTEAHASGIFAGQPDTPQIAIDDFTKIDLRVAKILVAERIPKADKLLRLEVDLGYEQRQILSGIAEHYAPEELIGRKIVIVANLAPRKMRGLESRGMLLAASEGESGKPILATFGEDIAVGTRLR